MIEVKKKKSFYHFHPRSSNWDKSAFLDKMLNLGEKSWVPALYPVELLGLIKKKNTTEESSSS